jgi:NAD(P)-dependent dehydrogenase (short-subunit alcohol dehydrogenase family)
MEQVGQRERACWLLVGGRTRLGRALAEDLAPDHDLVLTSSRPWEESRGPGTVDAWQWDASDPGLVPRMMADLERLSATGRALSGVVLVAGDFPEQPLGAWTPAELAQTWQLNLSFPLLVAQAVAPHLAEGACLQVLLDTAIHRPWLKRLPYSAAKAGLASLVAGLAQLLAPRVRVVGHALGTVLPAEDSDVAFLAGRTLLGRVGEPADLARAVRYAAASPFLTGEVMTLDGGRRWVDR